MSFANPRPENPASKFIDYKGDTGKFQHYQKPEAEGQEGKNIVIKLPIKFIVIDELSTIAGFNDAFQTGVYSNEVHRPKEILHVRLFTKKDSPLNKEISKMGCIGTYAEIKGDIKSLGGKYAKSVYALINNNGAAELVNFKVKGSFLNAWIESGINTDRDGILIKECIQKKKGTNTYFEPVIEPFEITDKEKTQKIARKYYDLLQKYFEQRKNYTDEQVIVEEETKTEFNEEGDFQASTDSDLPF